MQPTDMKLGVNLCFGVKRWLEPDRFAAIVRDELGLRYVQYSWDLTDPWWPDAPRDRRAAEYARAFRDAGLTIESSFGGIASYSYNHFLAPTAELRALGKEHLLRAIDMTAAMGVTATGMPFGSYSAADAADPARRETLYQEALEAWVELAAHARRSGLERLLVEPVPLATEFPASAQDALRLMRDLDGRTDVPVRLMVDWGHALFRPLFGDDASMEHWMATCGSFIDGFHIQQTDGLGDRHWNFTTDGLVTAEVLRDFWARHALTTQTLFLEIIYPFEATDDFVLSDMKAGVRILTG
jgi:sugar phosphate isomerase/epimerase